MTEEKERMKERMKRMAELGGQERKQRVGEQGGKERKKRMGLPLNEFSIRRDKRW